MLTPYTQKLRTALSDTDYTLPESPLRTPFDTDVVKEVTEKLERFRGKTKLVLLVGIGGSDLGTRAVFESLSGHMAQYIEDDSKTKLLSFSTIEPKVLSNISKIFSQYKSVEDIALVVISKSGSTTETLANANILFSEFANHFGKEQAEKQTIVISSADMPFSNDAEKRGMLTFTIPKNVGGRFSVFSPVGLVPLHLLGFDISAFLEGAREAFTASTTTEKASVSAVLASYLFEAYLKGARIHELFIWNPELETLGKWYRQLLAESIGKERMDGTRVGFSPTIAIGSTDLHSVGQLIFGGRNDRYTTFVSAPHEWQESEAFQGEPLFMLPVLEGKKSGEVTQAIYKGVQATYKANNLPFVTIELDAINERELGAFMALQMTTILFLAQLFDVHAFDQPAVELYKSKVRNLLTNK